MADNKENRIPNVPHLRFPEFDGEWEESTIGEQFDLYSGNTPSRLNKEHFNGSINWISSGELKEHYIKDSKEKISEEAAKNLKMLPKGTFVIAIYGLEAEGVRGTGSILLNNATISQACMAFSHKAEITNEFLYSWYKKHGNVIGIRYAQGTKQQNLSYDILEKFKISYPAIQEQEKLNRFISLLDKRITTQNKIIEKLESLIKGLVDELMSVLLKGKLYPFSSFYIRAGEGGTPTTSIVEYYTEGTIPFIKIEDLSCKYLTNNKDFITELGMQKSSAWLIPSKSVIYSNGATIGAISINEYPVCTKQGILGIVPNTNINVEYLYLLMSSSYFSKEISRIITEGTMKTAYLKDINHIKCPLPSKAQQKNITNLTSSIEEKLSIELKYLFSLNRQKKYLLRQMFI